MKTISTAFELIEAVVEKIKIEGICWACGHGRICPNNISGDIKLACEYYSNTYLEGIKCDAVIAEETI